VAYGLFVGREGEVLRALADPTRRAIFEQLTRGEAAVRELTARFDVSQPAVSQHLAALRAAGLVRERKSGRLVFYQACPAGMAPLLDWLDHYQEFWTRRLARLRKLLDQMEDE